MSTVRKVTVKINSAETWADIVGDDITKPRYVLCCGTIVVVGGDLQSNTVDNDPSKNVIDKDNKTISFEWEIPEANKIHHSIEHKPRSDNLVIPATPSPEAKDINFKQVYVVNRDKGSGAVTATIGTGTNDWVDKITIQLSFVGIENNFTIQPILWETVDGKGAPRVSNKYPGPNSKADYWVHGNGTISILPFSIINLWFQREAKAKSFSTVDQSDKGLINLDLAQDPAPLIYDEDNGWPPTTLEDIETTNAKSNGTTAA